MIVTCPCGTPFEENERFPTGICMVCDETRVSERRAEVAAQERTLRANRWPDFQLPFGERALATNRSQLPCMRHSELVLRWRLTSIGLVLAGDTGYGKTRTLIELLKDLWIDHAVTFEFCRVTDWRIKLDRAHRYGGTGVAQLVRPLCRAQLLALDDFGHGKYTETSLAAIFEIIDYRTSHGLPTILTTQKSKDQLIADFAKVDEKTGDAIVRRMSEFFRLIQFELELPLGN